AAGEVDHRHSAFCGDEVFDQLLPLRRVHEFLLETLTQYNTNTDIHKHSQKSAMWRVRSMDAGNLVESLQDAGRHES
ncbi:hypothetical protein, partial [uncultured Microbacterium sp.]|uniref:hypothetical protein n=1 Tax=uncultured Microbacterium sp. TaxID=191216 RepID=UPI002592E83A